MATECMKKNNEPRKQQALKTNCLPYKAQPSHQCYVSLYVQCFLCHFIRTQLAYAYQLQGKNDEAQKLYNQVLKSKYGHHSFLIIFLPII